MQERHIHAIAHTLNVGMDFGLYPIGWEPKGRVSL